MSNPPSRDAFSFFHPLRVRWAEVDPQSIVFNGHYLTYADVAITEYFRALGACRTFYPFRALKVSATIGALPLGVLADEPLRPC